MKKSLVMALCLAVCAALAISGTLAYMTDQTQIEVNVYTAGSVDVEMVEMSANNSYTKLEKFEQNMSLVPTAILAEKEQNKTGEITGTVGKHSFTTDGLWLPAAVPGVQDKVVFVYNNGTNPAYFRTFFAFEGSNIFVNEKIIKNLNDTDYDWFTYDDPFEYDSDGDGVNETYTLVVATYVRALDAGETAPASLKQIYMSGSVTKADMETEKIGDKYTIMVVTQASQTNYLVDFAEYSDNVSAIKATLDKAFYTKAGQYDEANGEYDTVSATLNPWTDDYADEVVTGDEGEEIPEGAIVIKNVAEFKAFRDLVNEGKTTDKTVVVLDADLDLANEPWTPIGDSKQTFKGKFDGRGHTIRNLVVNGTGKNDQGLFGYTNNGEIKNLKVFNAKVTGRLNVGVIAGTPYTTKYSNIEITGLVQVKGMSYVGGAFGKNTYANVNNVIINVTKNPVKTFSADLLSSLSNTSYVYADSVENGIDYRTYVGGVIGFMGEGSHAISNVTSNIDVYGSTCDVGGITGIAHYDNRFFNCQSTGNVTIFNSVSLDDGKEIGGIAGVWHNGDGHKVSLIGCSYSGTLTMTYVDNGETITINSEDDLGTFENKGIVGKKYSTKGTGELIIVGSDIDSDQNVVKTNELSVIKEGLKADKAIELMDDLKVEETESNAYGTTGLSIEAGATLDGQGNTLSVPNATGTWGSAINITGGTIKNLNIASGFRGVFINHNSNKCGPVVLENVIIDGTVYTISCDQGTNNGLTAINCTFNGWTSYAETLGNVTFTNCKFGAGQGYNYSRPYAPTTYVNCDFAAGHEMDAQAEVEFINCTIDGEPLTADNLNTLVTSNTNNAKVK